MCGIVAYVGQQPAISILLEGLKRLEYRGYDSAGVCVWQDGRLDVAKKAGRVEILVQEAAKQGYGEYRAHLDFMDLASAQYSFGDHVYRRFCETIKDALDPAGILAPGKQGIWPASMRDGGGLSFR